ncbi:hypothetical protein LTR56_004760 [Elasticomyces elasticus]|nr:hypothetical protein LTR56_004760 [Elasticomyces elasticus]KAK3665616.1 hypothetical protein LTR22_003556 [Elasticomyces elasticus]KAK4930346.1 hypothetical protein LTR49_003087 [Elasticomyces elasticus]KAK5768927.1 hypothetical protein LTS12_000987 [Elasticomyces elasticus]
MRMKALWKEGQGRMKALWKEDPGKLEAAEELDEDVSTEVDGLHSRNASHLLYEQSIQKCGWKLDLLSNDMFEPCSFEAHLLQYLERQREAVNKVVPGIAELVDTGEYEDDCVPLKAAPLARSVLGKLSPSAICNETIDLGSIQITRILAYLKLPDEEEWRGASLVRPTRVATMRTYGCWVFQASHTCSVYVADNFCVT